MARMLAGMECPIDPIPPHCHSDRSSFSGPEPGKGDSRPSSEWHNYCIESSNIHPALIRSKIVLGSLSIKIV